MQCIVVEVVEVVVGIVVVALSRYTTTCICYLMAIGNKNTQCSAFGKAAIKISKCDTSTYQFEGQRAGLVDRRHGSGLQCIDQSA
jgi:hypothetical protein